jgi:DNA-binding CsgD family transcriptional regulator
VRRRALESVPKTTLSTLSGASYLRSKPHSRPRRSSSSRPCWRPPANRCATRRGDRVRAAAALTEAIDVYEALTAARDVARTERALRDLGVRRGKRGRRGRPARGWDSLTDTERRVVQLVGEGLTNREVGQHLCISARTVETHRSHVFAKLGVTNRTALAAIAKATGDTGCLPAEHPA